MYLFFFVVVIMSAKTIDALIKEVDVRRVRKVLSCPSFLCRHASWCIFLSSKFRFCIPILHCVIHAMYLFSSWCDGVRLGVRLTSFSCGRMRGGGFAFSLAPPGSGSQCFPCAVCNRPPLRGKGKGAHARLVQPDPARLGLACVIPVLCVIAPPLTEGEGGPRQARAARSRQARAAV